MKNKLASALAVSMTLVFLQTPVFAGEETLGEKTSEAAQDTGKNIKKGTRAMKDKTCEMVKGKMECAGKKMKHKAKNAADEIKDKAEDVKH